MGPAFGKHQQQRHGQASEPASWTARGRDQNNPRHEHQRYPTGEQDPAPTPPPPQAAHPEATGGLSRPRAAREKQVGQQQEEVEPREGRRGGGAAAAAQEPEILTKKPEILKIMYSNIQSIQSKLYELNVQAVDLNPDIILLTETWCNQSVSDATLTIPNYHLETELRRDREDTTNGVGGR